MPATPRRLLAAGVMAAACAGAAAAEPSGCDKFKWPIAHEQAALAAPAIGPLDPGAALPADVGAQLKLVPFDQAKLALPPERAPKASPSYAGSFALAAPAAPGVFKVTVSAGGWIDIVQDGKLLKPINFSGAVDCPNVRKVVKFRLAAAPATLQLTGVGDPDISIIVSPE